MYRFLVLFRPQTETSLTIYLASSEKNGIPALLACGFQLLFMLREEFEGVIPNAEFDNMNFELIRSLKWRQRRKFKSYLSFTVEFSEEKDLSKFIGEMQDFRF